MEGQSARHAAGGRNGVHIGVAVIFPGEGDGSTVGREDRRAFEPDSGRQPYRASATARYLPQVAGITECDPIASEGRRLKHRVPGRRLTPNWDGGHEKEKYRV
jgi:hypothetical protein